MLLTAHRLLGLCNGSLIVVLAWYEGYYLTSLHRRRSHCSHGNHPTQPPQTGNPWLPCTTPFALASRVIIVLGKLKNMIFVSISQRANLAAEFLRPLDSYLSVELVHIVRTVLRLTAQTVRSVLSYSLLSRFVSICRDSSGSIYAPTAGEKSPLSVNQSLR